MNFPINLGVQNDIVAIKEKKIKRFVSDIREKQEKIERIEEQLKYSQRMLEILSNLPESWRISDPGKRHVAFFFLHDCSLQRVVVREFLSEGAICNSREEWNLYNKNRVPCDGFDYEKVPPWFPIVSLSEVHMASCDKCYSEQPVIERYVQKEGGRDGADWLKERFVFCLPCNTITPIWSQTSPHRF